MHKLPDILSGWIVKTPPVTGQFSCLATYTESIKTTASERTMRKILFVFLMIAALMPTSGYLGGKVKRMSEIKPPT